jgi:hypothetical protein
MLEAFNSRVEKKENRISELKDRPLKFS